MPTAQDELSRCLAIDLEVSPKDRSILAFAGVRADSGQSVVWANKPRSPALDKANLVVKTGDEVVGTKRIDSADQALGELDVLAEGAEFVLGHNLIEFDLPILRTADPGLRLLQLPAVDTLWINPLAFPRNPYHRLVKHYKDASLTRGDETSVCAAPRGSVPCNGVGRRPTQWSG